MMQTRRQLDLGYVLLILTWSTTYMFMKISVGHTPFLAASIRFVLGAVLLLGIQRFRGRPLWPDRPSRHVILYIGFLNYFMGYGFTYWAMPYLYSNVVSLLWATMPVFVAVYAHFMLPTERFGLAKAISLLLALYGSYLIFDIRGTQMGREQGLGYLMIMISIAVSAYSNVIYKRTGNEYSLDAFLINAYGMLIGAVLLSVASLLTEPWQDAVITPRIVGATLYLAVMGSAVAFTLYFVLMKYFSVVRMSYVTFLIPIFASMVGWVFLGEVLPANTILGGAIILLGVLVPDLNKRFFGGTAFRSRDLDT